MNVDIKWLDEPDLIDICCAESDLICVPLYQRVPAILTNKAETREKV